MRDSERFVVLFAKDNEDDVFLLKRAFKKAGLEVEMHRVEDGLETIDYLAGEGEFADRHRFPIPMVLVLDLMMPGLHGVEVVRWVRAHEALSHLPILIASDGGPAADVKGAMKAGASWFIKKDWKSEEVTELVALLKKFWQGSYWTGKPGQN